MPHRNKQQQRGIRFGKANNLLHGTAPDHQMSAMAEEAHYRGSSGITSLDWITIDKALKLFRSGKLKTALDG